VSTSVVKWSEGLINRVSVIIRPYTAVSFIIFFSIFFCLYLVLLYIWLYVLYASV